MRQIISRWGALAVVIALGASAPRSADAQCVAGFTQVSYASTFSCYRLTSTASDWFTAQANALSLGGYLAAIGSAAENSAARSFVTGLIGGADFWIGFNDQANEGTFVWVNGEPVTYTNWAGGEPNNFGNEDVAEVYSSGQWNDIPESQTQWGLVEHAAVSAVPEPSAMLLTASGLVGVLSFARRRSRSR